MLKYKLVWLRLEFDNYLLLRIPEKIKYPNPPPPIKAAIVINPTALTDENSNTSHNDW